MFEQQTLLCATDMSENLYSAAILTVGIKYSDLTAAKLTGKRTRRLWFDKHQYICQTSVCAYFRRKRWVSSHLYFWRGKCFKTDGRNRDGIESQRLDCFLFLFVWPSFLKQISTTSLLINHLLSISSPIKMTRLNRLEDVNTWLVAFLLLVSILKTMYHGCAWPQVCIDKQKANYIILLVASVIIVMCEL